MKLPQPVIYAVIIIISIMVTKYFSKLRNGILNYTQLFQKYWSVSVIIILVSLISHYLNYKFNPIKFRTVSEGSDYINFYSGLVFAIFTGSFAFKQFELSRFDKLTEEAYAHLRSKRYERAKILYREACKINPTDLTVLGNLTELALFINDDNLFFEKLKQLERLSLPDEKITPYYLESTFYLLKEDVGKAKQELQKLLTFIGNNPRALEQFSWGFQDLKNSDVYTNLKGDSKNYLDKLIKLLGKAMSDEERQNFFSKDVK